MCICAAGVIFAASGKGFWSAKPVDNEVSWQEDSLSKPT
jgi:hypothetical protein